MKREQICPGCGKPLLRDTVCLPVIRKHRLPEPRMQCPDCKAFMESRLLKRIKTVFLLISFTGLVCAVFVIAHQYTLHIGRDSLWDKALLLMVFPLYWIFLRAISALTSRISPQRQIFLLCNEEEQFIRYKPLYQACYRLSGSDFKRELVVDNILQLRNEKIQMYMQLKQISDSGECEFHPVPYPKNALVLPERAELWNGEEVVAVLEHIHIIGNE